MRHPGSQARWIVVVGEYGTGKTALTQILQRRWIRAYKEGEGTALPFRIELRNFSRQFDARGLLHHFLDRNNLSHLPVEFVESMIANGRIVLLLDGYDEMAQYLNVRERRACLEALADLSQGGARGILTSRPNYFTEAEELRVFEILYQRLAGPIPTLGAVDREVLEQERRVDVLLDRFVIRRLERHLRDLTPSQTRALVQRRLADDPEAARVVVRLLDRVFRPESSDESRALSGKPVIATYLLEIASELKQDAEIQTASDAEQLSEWQIFSLIVNKLMSRDYKRASELLPTERQRFLESLALLLTKRQAKTINEQDFMDLVSEDFRQLIARRSLEGSVDASQVLFDDLRSSSTLTRATSSSTRYTWQFSHNSLREFLLTERMIKDFLSDRLERSRLPISDLMKLFARSMPLARLEECAAKLSAEWPTRSQKAGLDQILALVYEGIRSLPDVGTPRRVFSRVAGSGMDISGTRLGGIDVAGTPKVLTDLARLRANDAEFVEMELSWCDLTDADFSRTVFDGCSFRGSDLTNANFDSAFLLDCDLTDIVCRGSVFGALDADSSAFVLSSSSPRYLIGEQLVGYLKFHGALTRPVESVWLYSHHPDFDIFDKIFRYIGEGGWRQRLGIEQKGVSKRNVALAKKIVKALIAIELVVAKSRDSALIAASSDGRSVFSRYVETNELDPRLEKVIADLLFQTES